MEAKFRIGEKVKIDGISDDEYICITQQWNEYDRIMIIRKDGNGSVEIELTKDDIEESIAYIYNIFVKEERRRNGIGRKLLCYAEELIKQLGYKESILDCKLINSLYFIFDWYRRHGYDDLETGNECIRMGKKL